ncbi:hypothetical protein ACWF7H_19305 [Peribacillus butanolivorans]|uniref:hypothetical protein n=1 Tax=Peribacillus butanolivorans TaxID=421767 RepID=UPI0036AF5673
MKKLIIVLLTFSLFFTIVPPGLANGIDNLQDSSSAYIDEDNWVEYESEQELLNQIEEINWDDVTLDVDANNDEINWNDIPIELDSAIVTDLQPRIWGLVARLVLTGGKYVIKYGKKVFKKAPTSKVTNALAKYSTGTYKTGSHTFKLTKTDMKHMLTRHHPKYWDGSVKANQTYYNPDLSVNDVKKIALNIAKQNKTTLSKKGTTSTFQVTGTVDGVKYVLGITKGHIKQLYPK